MWCWFPEGLSNSAPLTPQNLLSHWLLFSSLPQVFVSYFIRQFDVVNVPQAGIEECLNF
jgi:hypothetical protein